MQRVFLILAITNIGFGCDGEIEVNEQKLDSAGAKLQRTVEKGADSINDTLKKQTVNSAKIEKGLPADSPWLDIKAEEVRMES